MRQALIYFKNITVEKIKDFGRFFLLFLAGFGPKTYSKRKGISIFDTPFDKHIFNTSSKLTYKLFHYLFAFIAN